MAAPDALLVMGVSGSGKSTVGALLASELGWKFYDADDYHPEENRMKMQKGIPLNDEGLCVCCSHCEEGTAPLFSAPCSCITSQHLCPFFREARPDF